MQCYCTVPIEGQLYYSQLTQICSAQKSQGCGRQLLWWHPFSSWVGICKALVKEWLTCSPPSELLQLSKDQPMQTKELMRQIPWASRPLTYSQETLLLTYIVMRSSFAFLLAHPLKDMIQRWPLIVDRMVFLSFHNNQTLNHRWLYQSSPLFWMAMITFGTYLTFPTKSPRCIIPEQSTACASPSSWSPHFPPHCAVQGRHLQWLWVLQGEIHPQEAVGNVYSILPHQQTWVSDKTDKRTRPKVSRHPVQPTEDVCFQ